MAKQKQLMLTRLERIEMANAREADLVIAASCRVQAPREVYISPSTQPAYCDTNYNPTNNITFHPAHFGNDPSSN